MFGSGKCCYCSEEFVFHWVFFFLSFDFLLKLVFTFFVSFKNVLYLCNVFMEGVVSLWLSWGNGETKGVAATFLKWSY